MPDREQARSFLEQQALDARERAERFRTVSEGSRSLEAKRILADIAEAADQFAARLERQIQRMKAQSAHGASDGGPAPWSVDDQDGEPGPKS
jgi:hypothetical protein